MTLSTKIAAFAAATAIVVGMVAMPPSATASEEGRRNTAYALGAATLYLGLKKKTIPAIIAGAGTVYAAKRLDDAIDSRHARQRAYSSSSSGSSVYSSSKSSSSGRVSSARRVSSSSSGRSSGMSRNQLANHPYVQSLISSAYTKGTKAGYQNGYEQGLSAGYRKGFDAGSHMSSSGSVRPTGNSLAQSGATASDLYARVMEAH